MKFNIKRKPQRIQLNHEGAKAYALSPEMELYTLVATSMLEPTFYERRSDRYRRLVELIAEVQPEYVAKLAIYAREEMHLRSMPVVLVVELAKLHLGDNLVQRALARIIQRADEITEVLAYYQWANPRPGPKPLRSLSKQVQKGVAEAFNKFDAYQLAKYNLKGEVTLRDALFLTHPKPANDEQQAIFNQLVAGELPTPYTWEVALTQVGQQDYATEEARSRALRETWEGLIMSGKLGYMALLRNLRNLLQVGIRPDVMELVAERLVDPQAVRNSKQLPFRYLAAYREIAHLQVDGVQVLTKALEQATLVAAENIPGFAPDTRVLIASDVSGSMMQSVSRNSKVLLYDVGLVMSMLMRSRCENVETGIFGSTWMRMAFKTNKVLAAVEEAYAMNGRVGYATNGHLVIEELIQRREVRDKVLMFTDMQLWNSTNGGGDLQTAWLRYREKVAPEARLYIFDLAGYGAAPLQVLEEHGVALMAGWSDKVFTLLQALEEGKNAVQHIRRMAV